MRKTSLTKYGALRPTCKDCKVEMIERTHEKEGNVFYCPKCGSTKVEDSK